MRRLASRHRLITLISARHGGRALSRRRTGGRPAHAPARTWTKISTEPAWASRPRVVPHRGRKAARSVGTQGRHDLLPALLHRRREGEAPGHRHDRAEMDRHLRLPAARRRAWRRHPAGIHRGQRRRRQPVQPRRHVLGHQHRSRHEMDADARVDVAVHERVADRYLGHDAERRDAGGDAGPAAAASPTTWGSTRIRPRPSRTRPCR